VHLREAGGATIAIIEKVPVLLSAEQSATELEIPSGIDIPCDVLDRARDVAGYTSVLVRLHFHIQDRRGRSVFRVSESDVTGPRYVPVLERWCRALGNALCGRPAYALTMPADR
jgi:hypothetical protein